MAVLEILGERGRGFNAVIWYMMYEVADIKGEREKDRPQCDRENKRKNRKK